MMRTHEGPSKTKPLSKFFSLNSCRKKYLFSYLSLPTTYSLLTAWPAVLINLFLCLKNLEDLWLQHNHDLWESIAGICQ